MKVYLFWWLLINCSAHLDVCKNTQFFFALTLHCPPPNITFECLTPKAMLFLRFINTLIYWEQLMEKSNLNFILFSLWNFGKKHNDLHHKFHWFHILIDFLVSVEILLLFYSSHHTHTYNTLPFADMNSEI